MTTWTIEALREHISALLAERDLRLQQRFEAQSLAIGDALKAAEKAVSKAEIAAEKRFELLNELRDGVATKEQLEALEKVVLAQRDNIADLTSRLNAIAAHSGGISASLRVMVVALGVLSTLVTIVGAVIIIAN